MKTKSPSTSIIQGLLFTYDIENTDNFKREEVIASIDANNEKDLSELFKKLTKPEFLTHTNSEKNWFIDSTKHFLAAGDSFNGVFKTMATYFSTEIVDQRKFMSVLLRCLQHYKLETGCSQTNK